MTDCYVSQVAGITVNSGLPLISLQIENVLANNPALVTKLYNYFAIVTLLMIGLSAGKSSARFINILLPLWAAFEVFAGWLTFPDQGTGVGVIVACFGLAAMSYMIDVRHERFGIAGPGNLTMKLIAWVIIIQASVAFVNAAAIFPQGSPVATPTNNQYKQLTTDLSTQIGSMNAAGGLTAPAVDIVSQGTQMAIGALLFFLRIAVSLGAFSVVLLWIYPFLGQSAAGIAFLSFIQIAIWILYAFFILQLFRPGTEV